MGSIGLDVSILEEPRWTGVERSAVGLVRSLGAAEGGPSLLLYSRRPVPWPFPLGGRLAPRVIGGPSRTALWRETRLLSALRRDRVSALYSPVAAVPLLTRLPRLATVHEMPWLRHPGLEGRTREAIHRARIRAAARVAKRIFVPTETVAADLLALHPHVAGRVEILSFGIEEAFRPLEEGAWREMLRREYDLPEGPVALFVGKARRRKNLPALLEAFAGVRGSVRPAPSLVLAGVEAHEVQGAPGVHPLGFVPDRHLVMLYNLATVLVFPSLSEGFGFPPLEAMACGTPVVAARAGAVPEVLRDAALLVDPRSTRELAAAVAQVLTDPVLRYDLAARGRERASRFRWSGTAERALSVMASVAA